MGRASASISNRIALGATKLGILTVALTMLSLGSVREVRADGFSLRDFPERFAREWNEWKQYLAGGPNPWVVRSPRPRPTDSGTPEDLASPAVQAARAHREQISEAMRIVLDQESVDAETFTGLVSALNQGASFEGVYNGLVHSSAYRERELSRPDSTVEARAAFAEMLWELERALTSTVEITSRMSETLSRPVDPAREAGTTSAAPTQLTDAHQAEAVDWQAACRAMFARASIFTLKRVAGDVLLDVIAEKHADRAALAKWFADWSAHLANRGVDFGLALRNRPDAAFHQAWALHASTDQLTWEALNRLHRVLNRLNIPSQPIPQSSASPGDFHEPRPTAPDSDLRNHGRGDHARPTAQSAR